MLDEDGNEIEAESAQALIDQNQFNDFVDSVQDGATDDDTLFLMAYSHSHCFQYGHAAQNKDEDRRYL